MTWRARIHKDDLFGWVVDICYDGEVFDTVLIERFDDAIDYALEYISDALIANCTNCDGRRCMACVFREYHDECEDSCPFCCKGEL